MHRGGVAGGLFWKRALVCLSSAVRFQASAGWADSLFQIYKRSRIRFTIFLEIFLCLNPPLYSSASSSVEVISWLRQFPPVSSRLVVLSFDTRQLAEAGMLEDPPSRDTGRATDSVSVSVTSDINFLNFSSWCTLCSWSTVRGTEGKGLLGWKAWKMFFATDSGMNLSTSSVNMSASFSVTSWAQKPLLTSTLSNEHKKEKLNLKIKCVKVSTSVLVSTENPLIKALMVGEFRTVGPSFVILTQSKMSVIFWGAPKVLRQMSWGASPFIQEIGPSLGQQLAVWLKDLIHLMSCTNEKVDWTVSSAFLITLKK